MRFIKNIVNIFLIVVVLIFSFGHLFDSKFLTTYKYDSFFQNYELSSDFNYSLLIDLDGKVNLNSFQGKGYTAEIIDEPGNVGYPEAIETVLGEPRAIIFRELETSSLLKVGGWNINLGNQNIWELDIFSLDSFINFPKGITYEVPAIILAQFTVSCAFAVRTMRNTFENIDRRQEEVALTLGCNRGKAFWTVIIQQAKFGIITSGILAWARSLGEFGPILVFAGATRGKTEVLSTSVFLEISIGNLEGAVAISFLMITAALVVLVIVRILGTRKSQW